MAGNYIFKIKKWAKTPQTWLTMDPNPANPSAECPALPQTCPAVWHCTEPPPFVPAQETNSSDTFSETGRKRTLNAAASKAQELHFKQTKKTRKFFEFIKVALVQREMLTQLKAQSLPQVCPYEGNYKSILFLHVFRLDFLLLTATCSLPHQDGLAGSTDSALGHSSHSAKRVESHKNNDLIMKERIWPWFFLFSILWVNTKTKSVTWSILWGEGEGKKTKKPPGLNSMKMSSGSF